MNKARQKEYWSARKPVLSKQTLDGPRVVALIVEIDEEGEKKLKVVYET